MARNAGGPLKGKCPPHGADLPLRYSLWSNAPEHLGQPCWPPCPFDRNFQCLFHGTQCKRNLQQIASKTFRDCKRTFRHSPCMETMRKIDKARGQRIRYVRTELLQMRSQEKFADWIGGVTRGAVGNWETGKDVSIENLKAIADKAGISLDWLAFNRGEKPQPTGERRGAVAISQRRNREAIDIVRVPDLAIFGGMGGGGALEVYVDDDGEPTDEDQVRGFWTFPEYIVRGLGSLKHIYAWEVRGDSMEPTLAGGAVVFVNTHQNSPPPDDLYAINYGDGLMVKRLKLIPRTDRISVISDNERYGADDLLREDVKIWGRVVGWFQWRG